MMPRRGMQHEELAAVEQRELHEDRDLSDAKLSEEMIDESLKETFPASDPPSLVRARIGPPRRT
jgi:hypothetical protein